MSIKVRVPRHFIRWGPPVFIASPYLAGGLDTSNNNTVLRGFIPTMEFISSNSAQNRKKPPLAAEYIWKYWKLFLKRLPP